MTPSEIKKGKTMKFKLHTVMFLSALILSACSDGVPKVDDTTNIVVNGKKLKAYEFRQQYCEGGKIQGEDYETCQRVRMQAQKDKWGGELGVTR
jgi:hypothetical protein